MGLWRSQVAHRTLNPVVEGPNPSRPALKINFQLEKIIYFKFFVSDKTSKSNSISLGNPFHHELFVILKSEIIFDLIDLPTPISFDQIHV